MRQAAACRFNDDQFQANRSAKRDCGVSEMRANTSASQASGSTSLSFDVASSVVMTASRSASRSEPAKSPDFLPSANRRSTRSAALLVQAEPPVVDEVRERVPAPQHVVDRLGDDAERESLPRSLTKPIAQTGEIGVLRAVRASCRSSALIPLMSRFYSVDRKAERPAAHLGGFRGILQVNGYGGFKHLTADGSARSVLDAHTQEVLRPA